MHLTIKRGMVLRHAGRYYFVEDVVERHSGQQKPTIHLMLRDALDGRHIDRTADELEPLEEVAAGFRMLQYLYAKGGARVFMDEQSFDEVEVPPAAIHGGEAFLKEGQDYRVLFVGEQPLLLDLPANLLLQVTDTAPPAHGVGAQGSVLKEAVLENGLEVRVPLFIKTGDVVKVDTRTKEYLGKG